MGSRRQGMIAAAVFTLLGALLLAGALRDFDHLGGKDWEENLGQAQAELTSLRDYGQLPLWNPWRAGGQPSWAQPVSMFLSPITLVTLLFGVVTGFKLALLPVYLTGCLGMWALAGHLGLTGLARLVPGLVLFGSSIFPLYLVGGLPNWLFTMALLPWLFLWHRRAADDARFVVLTGLAWAGLLFCGAIDRFLFVPLLLGLDALAMAALRRSPKPLFALTGALALGAGLGAIRVLPVLEIYLQFPREMESATRYVPPSLLPRIFLGTQLPDLVSLAGGFIRTGANQTYWVNAGSYVGPVALALAFAGAALRARATWVFSLLALVMAWLSFGVGVTPSLWSLLHHVPVLESLRGPERLILFVTLCLAVLAGFGFAAIERGLEARGAAGPRVRRALLLALLLATVLPMVAVNAPISRNAFIVPPPPDLREGGWFAASPERAPFLQRWFQRDARQWTGKLWEPVVRNRGNLGGPTNIPLEASARPRGSSSYRGEAFLERSGREVAAEFTPNRIRVRARVSEADRLVINQNFFPGWRAGALGPAEPFEGLISLPLPPGEHEVELSFRPRSVLAGALLTLVSGVLGALLYFRASRARSATPPSASARATRREPATDR